MTTDPSTGTRSDFESALLQALTPWNRCLSSSPSSLLSPLQRDLLWCHYLLVVEANRVMNLTRITEPRATAVRHYADSLAFTGLLARRDRADGVRVEAADANTAVRLLDVGTGAGFPAVPLAVVLPAWKITAIDSTKKKADFVARCARELGLENLRVEHARAEHWHPGQTFDFVVLRAVALEAGLQKVRHLIGPRGCLVFYGVAQSGDDHRSMLIRRAERVALQYTGGMDYALALDDRRLHRVLHVFRAA